MTRWSRMTPAVALAAGVLALPASAQDGRTVDMMTMERPIAAPDVVWIEEMTMPEVRDAIRGGATTALILTGGIEENGPYLTTGKHNHVLEVTGEAIARRMGNALIAPIVTLEPGNPENVRNPGSIFLSRETYEAMLRDMVVSLKSQGFTDIFLLGDSGGNQRSMAAVAEALTAAWGTDRSARVHHVPEFYNYDDVLAFQRDELGIDEDPRLEGLHDDYYITSIIMNEDPRHVRWEERVAAGKASINGISIADKQRTLEHGRRIIEFRTDATVAAMKQALRGARGG